MASILVVDDDASARDLLKTVLGYAQHDVREAHDGAEALRSLHHKSADLVIVDLLMPTMDGIEFVRRLRISEQASIPVIFYTASCLYSEAHNLAQLCGVSHVITKPAEPQQIYDIVNRVLGEDRAPIAAPAAPEIQHEYMSVLTANLSQRATHTFLQLQAMIELGLRLASENDPRQLLSEFCETAGRIIGATSTVVTVKNGSDNTSQYQFASGAASGLADGPGTSFVQTAIHEEVFASRQPRRVSNLPGDPAVVGLPVQHPAVHSLLCAPIQSPQRVYGWLSLTEKIDAEEFSVEDEALAQILASQVGRIYENASLYREIRTYAERLESEVLERKQAQNEARALNAELENRVRERTRQLEAANTELEAFGYSISHDLRAPLRAIGGFSSLALQTEESHLTETGRHYLEQNVLQAQRLGGMVDDLLRFCQLGRQGLTLRHLDVDALVHEVWEELINEDTGPSVTARIGSLPPCHADRTMLRQVWVNLISNALKYSSKSAQRAIEIDAVIHASELEYSIHDNGVGFDMAYADKLFKVFSRLHNVRDFAGTGAGLSIVERIVRRHGGRVWAHGEPGIGSTFYFALPRSLNNPI